MASDKKCDCNHRTSRDEYLDAMIEYDIISSISKATGSAMRDAYNERCAKEERMRKELRRQGKDPNSVISIDRVIAWIILILGFVIFFWLNL